MAAQPAAALDALAVVRLVVRLWEQERLLRRQRGVHELARVRGLAGHRLRADVRPLQRLERRAPLGRQHRPRVARGRRRGVRAAGERGRDRRAVVRDVVGSDLAHDKVGHAICRRRTRKRGRTREEARN